MKKQDAWTCKRQSETHRHGSRAVLILQSELPCASTPAAVHFSHLREKLFAHAAQKWLPIAAKELEDAVQAGRGYTFTPVTVRLFCGIRLVRGAALVTLSLFCTQGERVLETQRTTYCWSADGAHQRRRPPLFSRRDA